MTNHTKYQKFSTRHRISTTAAAAAMAVLVFGGPACGMEDSFGPLAEDVSNNEANADLAELRDAEQALANHQVNEARQLYADFLDRYPDHGAASAGLAITNLLLLLELDEVNEFLIETLGADHQIDANAVLFAEGGYLYWASRGARWHDDGEYRGISSLLEDELPWSKEQLSALTKFVDGLDDPAQQGIRQLVWVANALPSIDQNLARAIDDPNFQRLYLPGEVFHSSELSLQLGRSELSLLRSALAALRGVIYFVAAYEHPWSLEEAFGQWRYDTDITHPYYDPDFEPSDYSVVYLDVHLFRQLGNPDRLNASQGAFKKAVEFGRHTVSFGVEERSATTLRWERVDQDDARDLDEFLSALHRAFDEPSPLPHVEPSVTVDLRPLFAEGRVLAEEISWFERTFERGSGGVDDDEPSLEGLERWKITDEARHTFWLDGIADPIPNDHQWRLTLGPDGDPQNFVDYVFGHYLDQVNDVYNTAR